MISERIRNNAVRIASLLIGVAFVFSGFVKAIDPLGTAYKIEDYFEAFQWPLFSGLSLFFSILLSAFEFYLGASLLLRLSKRTTILFLVLFMAVVTPFTLYLAIRNPVSDCGCFGDAIVLTNWGTFIKNLILLTLVVLVYLNQLSNKPYFGTNSRIWAGLWVFAFPVLMALYAVMYLPLIDFRPYKAGNYLPDLMQVDAESGADQMILEFIYEKDGKQQSFSVDNAPVSDSTWTFVERKETLISKAQKVEIHDFELIHSMKGDITFEVLQDTSYTFLMIAPKLEQMNYAGVKDFLAIKSYALKHRYAFYLLTSSNTPIIEDWKFEFDPGMQVLSVDETTLKTMIRSNPGLLLLKAGRVIGKWGFRNLPDVSDSIDRPWQETVYNQPRISVFKRLFLSFVLFVLPLLLLWLLHHGYRFTFKKKLHTIQPK